MTNRVTRPLALAIRELTCYISDADRLDRCFRLAEEMDQLTKELANLPQDNPSDYDIDIIVAEFSQAIPDSLEAEL